MMQAVDEIYAVTISMWSELLFVFAFAVGLAALRVGSAKRPKTERKVPNIFKSVHAEAASGNASTTLNAWRAVQKQSPTPCDTLKLVTQAFLESDPSSLINEIVDHFSLHGSDPYVSKAMAALEVVARTGNEAIMDGLFQAYARRLRMPVSVHMQEILLGGHAHAANEAKVTELVSKIRESRQKVTARGYSMMVRGFLKNGMLDAAVVQTKEMRSQGLNVPSFAVSEIFRIARSLDRTMETYHTMVKQEVHLTTDAAAAVLDDCWKAQDLMLAKDVERQARKGKVQLNFHTYEVLLKLHTSAGDARANELFEEMQRVFPYISDGFCVNLISRCAEPKLLKLAEQIVTFLRARGKMTIAVYSALMKVYSYSHMYDQACDLYEQLRADGLEPDSVMYGCLMRFSAECGRTELTRQFSTRVDGLDRHHHMSLIRAAGQDKDAVKAVAVFHKFKESGASVDTPLYNAVLDVCSLAGDMGRARELATQMRKEGLLDIISYNTLLKGYSIRGDMDSANEVIADMDRSGVHPNDVSYNCLINLAASAGDFGAAWRTIETMERKGVRIDHYTLSTMMKALKRAPSSKEGRDSINKVFVLLDRHHVDVCCEEVLLNTSLEACMKHGENHRLENLLNDMTLRTHLKLALHTYANLIKVSGLLKQIQHCRGLWVQMTEVQGLEPSGVALGCMLDALVCNGSVKEGVSLLRKWQDRVPVNTILYSTLIKGFANIRDTQGAFEMWRELRNKGLPLNAMVYNAIIDAHARVGATSEVSALLKSMEAEKVEPDEITKSIVAKCYCMTGDLDRAMEVFRSLPVQPSANTVVVYNTILDGCCRHNRMEWADELLSKMEEYRIQPSNFTLGIIVKMWGRRRRLDEAFGAVNTLPKKYGFSPNQPVRTCLLFACLRNDALDRALQVLHDIRAAGMFADSKVFSALVSSCTRAGKFERAVSLIEEAYGLANGGRRALSRNDDINPACLEQLVKGLSKQEKFHTLGVPLLKKMQSAHINVSSRVLASTFGEA